MNNQPKVLIMCGPTATGKTAFALRIAKIINGEIISADSRQIYKFLDIVTGKDITQTQPPESSELKFQGKSLPTYNIGGINIWLYDVITPEEKFSAALWSECANLVINKLLESHKIPIIVGGTGLYIKSIINPFTITVPPDQALRLSLSQQSTEELLHLYTNINRPKALSLNNSDRHNPRRLIRAIEIEKSVLKQNKNIVQNNRFNILSIGLTSDKKTLLNLINKRVAERCSKGAIREAVEMVTYFGISAPGLSACGYKALISQDPMTNWEKAEHKYLKKQLTWFNKQADTTWFDISKSDWANKAIRTITEWYNK